MSDDSDKAGIGCVILFLLIFIIPMLIELVKVLIPLVAFAGIGYGIYRLVQYDAKTGNVTELFEKTFQVGNKGLPSPDTSLELPQSKDGTYGLPEGKRKEEISDLKEIILLLKQEKEEASQQRKKDIDDALRRYGNQIDKKNKEELLNDVFGVEPEDYSQADVFEKRKHQEEVKKQKDELEIEELKLNVDKQIFEQDKKIYVFKDEAKEDRHNIRMEMHEGFTDVNNKLLHLEMDIATFKGFVAEKFSSMEVQFFKELSNVKDMISRLRVEVKQELSDTRVMFGKEIMRIDKQQMRIVGKLQEYETKVRAFSLEVGKVKLDCERFAMRGEDMLNRANTIYQRHRADMSVISKELNMNLKQMAVHKMDFSNKVGQSKLMLDRISQDQYLALKDIAIEKVGVNMLRQDYQQRVSVQEQKMQNLVNEKRHLLEKINMNVAQGREVAGLRHQLHMTEESLRHASNRASLMQQEAAIVKRLSK